ncbi:hypothetical protein C8R43DRAFT_1003132 [Mycena crocata]|nr:hypothetical protein C8R43DRAFT_1003132 [Mycena crocata]
MSSIGGSMGSMGSPQLVRKTSGGLASASSMSSIGGSMSSIGGSMSSIGGSMSSMSSPTLSPTLARKTSGGLGASASMGSVQGGMTLQGTLSRKTSGGNLAVATPGMGMKTVPRKGSLGAFPPPSPSAGAGVGAGVGGAVAVGAAGYFGGAGAGAGAGKEREQGMGIGARELGREREREREREGPVVIGASARRKSSLGAGTSASTPTSPAPSITHTRTPSASSAHFASLPPVSPYSTSTPSLSTYTHSPYTSSSSSTTSSSYSPHTAPIITSKGARTHAAGHGRSVSVSGPIAPPQPLQPVRKGSDSAVVSSSSTPTLLSGTSTFAPAASQGAQGAPGNATPRPFVAPPPPPPLVTVRTKGASGPIVSPAGPGTFSAGNVIGGQGQGSAVGGGASNKSPTSTKSSSSPPSTARVSPTSSRASPTVNLSPGTHGVSPSTGFHPSHIRNKSSTSGTPPPPPPPPLSMGAVLRARSGGMGGSQSASSGSPHSSVSAGSAYSAGGYASSHHPQGPSPQQAHASAATRSPPGGAWHRYSAESQGTTTTEFSESPMTRYGGGDSPMTAITTPGSGAGTREAPWKEYGRDTRDSGKEYTGSPLGNAYSPQMLGPPTPNSPHSLASPGGNKRDRRRLRLHSPIDVDVASQLAPEDSAPLTPPIHSHPLEDESEEGGAGPDSAATDEPQGWLAALEGEVRGEEMDGVALSPPTFAAADPAHLDPDDDALDLYDDFGDFDDTFDANDGSFSAFEAAPTRGRRERSPSPIRYARRASVDQDLIMSDSSEEDDMSDLDRAPTDGASINSPAPSFNDARSTFSRARSTRSRRRRRNTRAAPPPVPLGSAAGLHRPRARSADSSIMGFGEALAPSEMYRLELAQKAAQEQQGGGGQVTEMRYVYAAAATQLPASIPPPPQLLGAGGSYASLSGASQSASASGSGHGHAPASASGHGSFESGRQQGYYSPSTSKSSLPLPPPPKTGLKLLRREKKEKEKARDKAMRKSNSFSLLKGGHGGGTANSSVEALMLRGNAVLEGRASSSSGGSDELGRPQRSNSNKPLFSYLYDPGRGR